MSKAPGLPSGEPAADRSSAWDNERLLLSFDGGGTRGFASLLILQRLMEEIEKEEQTRGYTSSFGTTNEKGFFPCHYFDFIYGTSTGGLNAIMLGRLRMKVDECIEMYPKMCENIFGRHRRSLKGLWRGRYNAKYLRREIETVVTSKTPERERDNQDSKWRKLPSPDDLCRTACISTLYPNGKGKASKIYHFRTYPQGERADPNALVQDTGRASHFPIWQVARATSAAPTYFKEMRIGESIFIDGGLTSNNPAPVAFTSLKTHQGGRPSLILSIGTGKLPASAVDPLLEGEPEETGPTEEEEDWDDDTDEQSVDQQPAQGNLQRVWRGVKSSARLRPVRKAFSKNLKLLDVLQAQLTNTELQHRTVKDRMEDAGRREYYFRFNPGPELGGLGLDEWDRDRMVHAVNSYLRDRQPKMKRCAKYLVDVRVRRMESQQRWQRWAYSKLLRCGEEGCRRVLDSTGDLVKHLQNVHGRQPPDGRDERMNWAFMHCTMENPEIPGGPW